MTGSGGSPAKPQPERQAVTTSTRMRLAFQPAAKIGLGICQCDFEPLQHQINSRGQQGRLPRSSKLLAPQWLPMPCPQACPGKADNREGTEKQKLGKPASSPVPFRAARPPHSGPRTLICKVVCRSRQLCSTRAPRARAWMAVAALSWVSTLSMAWAFSLRANISEACWSDASQHLHRPLPEGSEGGGLTVGENAGCNLRRTSLTQVPCAGSSADRSSFHALPQSERPCLQQHRVVERPQ